MDDPLKPLHLSVERLHGLAGGLSAAELAVPSYCSEWDVAGVLSHLGSAAVIFRRLLADALAGLPTPDNFAESVWDDWNAKPPEARAHDALAADAELLSAFEALPEPDRARVRVTMGSLTFDFDEFVAARLNEHALHTWDVEVAFDGEARVPDEAAAVIVDNLGMLAHGTGRPKGQGREVRVRTSEPRRNLLLDLAPGGVVLSPDPSAHQPDLELPAESFCRLVYGRLDPEHTPAVAGDADELELLRRVFPGP